MDRVKNVLVVISGKGGVGKSSVTVQLACHLCTAGKKVGVLDVDLCGPSIPKMLGLPAASIAQGEHGWLPIEVQVSTTGSPVKVISMSFLLPNQDNAIIWRGPKKTAMIKQFLNNVDWGDLDVLIIDTPPGTSDEHLSVLQESSLVADRVNMGAVIVTTPQLVALQDVDKQVSFCKELQVPIVGVIENMSGYICTQCSHCNNVFSSGGGEQLAAKNNLCFLGELPILPALSTVLDGRESAATRLSQSAALDNFKQIGDKIVRILV